MVSPKSGEIAKAIRRFKGMFKKNRRPKWGACRFRCDDLKDQQL
jgi:hypothetical protein